MSYNVHSHSRSDRNTASLVQLMMTLHAVTSGMTPPADPHLQTRCAVAILSVKPQSTWQHCTVENRSHTKKTQILIQITKRCHDVTQPCPPRCSYRVRKSLLKCCTCLSTCFTEVPPWSVSLTQCLRDKTCTRISQ